MTISEVKDHMTRPVRVRLAELDEAEKITNIINSAFRRAEEFFIDEDRIDVASVLSLLNTGKFLLAESDCLVLGCVYVEPRPVDDARQRDHAYLGLLAVDPERQQSGLGSLLMDAAEEYCRGLSCRCIDIKVVNLREQLSGFYHRRGYVESGTSPFPTDAKTKLPCHFIDMSKPLRAL
jgi:predicted N-acetyltransferase YhbS